MFDLLLLSARGDRHASARPFVGMSPAVAAQLADTGAFIEVTEHKPVKDRVEMIRTVGAGRCFLSTDGGTVSGPPPATRISSFI